MAFKQYFMSQMNIANQRSQELFDTWDTCEQARLKGELNNLALKMLARVIELDQLYDTIKEWIVNFMRYYYENMDDVFACNVSYELPRCFYEILRGVTWCIDIVCVMLSRGGMLYRDRSSSRIAKQKNKMLLRKLACCLKTCSPNFYKMWRQDYAIKHVVRNARFGRQLRAAKAA